ncbi:unnamed protein product, partial [Scytosiphon promiscuus]
GPHERPDRVNLAERAWSLPIPLGLRFRHSTSSSITRRWPSMSTASKSAAPVAWPPEVTALVLANTRAMMVSVAARRAAMATIASTWRPSGRRVPC